MLDKPEPLYDAFATKFKPEELELFCEKLKVDYYNLGSNGRKIKALRLQQHMMVRGRLHELLAKLCEERPQIDYKPYLYLVVAELFSTEERMINLLQSFGVNVRNFGGPERFSWGSEAWREHKALALQDHMEKNGRIQELLDAIRQRNQLVDLAFYVEPDKFARPSSDVSPVKPTRRDEDKPVEYANFDIGFVYREDGRFTVKVSRSPKGQKTAGDDYKLDLNNIDLWDRIAFLRGLVARPDDAVQLGEYLRQALLPTKIMGHLRESVTEAEKAGKKGVRIRLFLDLKQPRLGQIPWEYCRDRRRFLSTKTPVVRYLETDQPDYEPIAAPGKMRILVAAAGPSDYDELKLDAEVAGIENALAELKDQVELKIIKRTTKSKLVDTITFDFKPHVLHFIGHGDFKKDKGALVLLKDDSPEARSDLFDADDMLYLLQPNGDIDVKLVVLSACLTAAYKTSEAIMGLAPRLVDGGLPAVIAMQFAIPDKTAALFFGDFYRFLAAGNPLDTAMTNARNTTFLKSDDKVFWGIPVLFMRTPDGRLWQSD